MTDLSRAELKTTGPSRRDVLAYAGALGFGARVRTGYMGDNLDRRHG
jgi:hypothetical protein